MAVTMDMYIVPRRSALWPNLCVKGRTSGRESDPSMDTMVAMILSAGTSAPIRPVYGVVYESKVRENWMVTYKRDKKISDTQ